MTHIYRWCGSLKLHGTGSNAYMYRLIYPKGKVSAYVKPRKSQGWNPRHFWGVAKALTFCEECNGTYISLNRDTTNLHPGKAECKITAGHWPIPAISLKWPNSFRHGTFTLYTWPIKFMKNWKNGWPFQISYFAVCKAILSTLCRHRYYGVDSYQSETDTSIMLDWGCGKGTSTWLV